MAAPVLTDFDALRQHALAQLQRLAGRTWTDHNSHDPGITLLESLCYALTDLGYRTGHPVQDLLAVPAGESADSAPASPWPAGLYRPAQVLPSGPVTLDDLRRLVIDLPGVKNAWIEPLDEPLGLHDAAQQQWSARPASEADTRQASPNVTLVRPCGLYRVRIEKSGFGEDVDGGALVRLAAQRLQAWRGLGEDIADISVLDRAPVALDATLELAAGADGAEVLSAVYATLARYCSPALPWRSLRDMLDRGWRVDQIFEGPLLSRGFLDPAEWAAAGRRSTLRLSDLIRELMAVPGLQAVKSLGFLRDGQVSRDWLLPIAADRCAAFDLDASRLRLERAGLRVDHVAMRDTARRLYEARARSAAATPAAAAESTADADAELAPPPGRSRQVGHYLSVQHHLPPVYGVGPNGLSDHEPVHRHAQARQLQAYLLVFDQLLANQFAQLAQARRLLSFDDTGDEVEFAQAVADEGGSLQLDRVRRPEAAQAQPWLAAITRDPWGDDSAGDRRLARRHRLVDHLLARLGEHWGEQRPVPDDDAAPGTAEAGPAGEAAPSPRQLALRHKQAFLRDYPALSVRRGSGQDMLQADALAPGLVQRLARLLGWDEARSPLPVVEHILLRPLPGDAFQQGPLMRAVAARDPFSLQISLVLPADDARLADPDLRQRVQRAVHDEAPAHLSVRLVWLRADDRARCGAVLAHWQALARQEGRRRFGLEEPPPEGADTHQIALRSARNRVIDALGLADTLPLTDLRVADGSPNGPIRVAYGRSARIAIDHAEADVRYELRGPAGEALRDAEGAELPAVAADGANDRLVLESPPVTEDITFRVRATKTRQPPGLPPQAPVLLAQAAPVKVGLDKRLALGLPGLPLLDATLANPGPGDARLCVHGARVAVQVHLSQEGVVYQLVVDDVVQPDEVIGDLATITLTSPPLAEDVTLAVRATKRFNLGPGGQAEQELLDARLRVAVRAETGAALQQLPGPVLDWRDGAAVLRLSRSQASVGYRLWVRRVRDAQWLRDDAQLGVDGLLRFAAEGPGLAPPKLPDDGTPPPGFAALGDAAPAGNGGPLDLPLGAPADDLLCLVQTTKLHAAPDVPVTTTDWLQAAALVVVRPDPAPALRLALVQAHEGGPVGLRLAGGQPGVAYLAQPLPDGPVLPEAAYLHQCDDDDAALNKGLGQLVLGTDLVVACDAPGAVAESQPDNPVRAAAGADAPPPERRRPAAPLLGLPALAAGTPLGWLAVKRQTGVDQPLKRRATLPALPAVTVKPVDVAPSAAAEVQVAETQLGETWQLWLDGAPLGAPVPGTGAAVVLGSGPVHADTLLVLRADAAVPADDWPLHREWPIALWCLPRADLPLVADSPTLTAGEGTTLQLSDSQPGVVYQLQADGTAVGPPQAGQGAALALPTGPLAADTRFTVVATRVDRPQATLVLAAQVLVTVQPAPAAAPTEGAAPVEAPPAPPPSPSPPGSPSSPAAPAPPA